MAKKPEEKIERRRFEEQDRKAWSKEERESYEGIRAKLAPIVRDLTTPAKKEEKKKGDLLDWLAS